LRGYSANRLEPLGTRVRFALRASDFEFAGLPESGRIGFVFSAHPRFSPRNAVHWLCFSFFASHLADRSARESPIDVHQELPLSCFGFAGLGRAPAAFGLAAGFWLPAIQLLSMNMFSTYHTRAEWAVKGNPPEPATDGRELISRVDLSGWTLRPSETQTREKGQRNGSAKAAEGILISAVQKPWPCRSERTAEEPGQTASRGLGQNLADSLCQPIRSRNCTQHSQDVSIPTGRVPFVFPS
jgi:hypothetical protein